MDNDEKNGPPPRWGSLWLLTIGPIIWSLHLLLSYITAAVWCAKVAGRIGPLDGLRTVVIAYTVLALAGIAITAWRGWRQHTFGRGTAPHDANTAIDRHRFLGFATLLLCGLSFLATVYVTLPVIFIGGCQ